MLINNKRTAPMNEPKNVIRETDEEARQLARRLIRTASFGALAVNSGTDGFPFVGRVSVSTDQAGTPVMLVSELSTHTKALKTDCRCSLLLGEPGKGDPLAHPRISLICNAQPIARDNQEYANVRARFIRRHPKAKLYVDFGDFWFFRLAPKAANLNGGFGKAFELEPDDFLIDQKTNKDLIDAEESAIDHMNEDHSDFVDKIAYLKTGESKTGWRLISLDAEGAELARNDKIVRCDFTQPIISSAQLKDALIGLGI